MRGCPQTHPKVPVSVTPTGWVKPPNWLGFLGLGLGLSPGTDRGESGIWGLALTLGPGKPSYWGEPLAPGSPRPWTLVPLLCSSPTLTGYGCCCCCWCGWEGLHACKPTACEVPVLGTRSSCSSPSNSATLGSDGQLCLSSSSWSCHPPFLPFPSLPLFLYLTVATLQRQGIAQFDCGHSSIPSSLLLSDQSECDLSLFHTLTASSTLSQAHSSVSAADPSTKSTNSPLLHTRTNETTITKTKTKPVFHQLHHITHPIAPRHLNKLCYQTCDFGTSLTSTDFLALSQPLAPQLAFGKQTWETDKSAPSNV